MKKKPKMIPREARWVIVSEDPIPISFTFNLNQKK